MTPEYLLIMALIAGLSVVQSVFGMGILIFGTPTLLIAGYDFITVLGYLLPASFAISLIQVLTGRRHATAVSPYLYILCVPCIGIGLWAAKFTQISDWLNLLIGCMLLLTAAVRFSARAQVWLSSVLERSLGAFHVVMGLIHGLTNLGGGALAVLASARSHDKAVIRYTVAHYYLAFSVIQMAILAAFMGQGGALLANLPMLGVSVAVYLVVGNVIFARASNPIYNKALTVFMAAYGIVVLLKL